MVYQIINLLSVNGYAIGLGVEGAVALIAGVFLILLLANVFAKRERAPRERVKKVRAEKPAEEETESTVEVTDGDKPVEIIREINTVYVPVNMGDDKAEEKADKKDDKTAAASEEKSDDADKQSGSKSIIINVYNNEEKKDEEEATEESQDESGINFRESKTIEELYAELSDEQKRFFDELKNAALAKPNATLSITRTYENVKVGKRSILKLVIRRGVTVAEFLLENDALREYRLKGTNKTSKNRIKIKPTVLAVTEDDTLKAALDMINLTYQQVIDDAL